MTKVASYHRWCPEGLQRHMALLYPDLFRSYCVQVAKSLGAIKVSLSEGQALPCHLFIFHFVESTYH